MGHLSETTPMHMETNDNWSWGAGGGRGLGPSDVFAEQYRYASRWLQGAVRLFASGD